MAEPFKNIYNPTLIEGMAVHLARVSTAFDKDVFLKTALAGLDDLEMLARAEQISLAIDAAFPDDFSLKRTAMVAALHPRADMELSEMKVDDQGIAGWAGEPMARVIARHGLDDPAPNLEALCEMTMRFSSEFAVRPFFRDHPQVTMAAALRWAKDDNHHVRRLASEGSRPLLPWGIKLHGFVQDPSALIPLLTGLRDDPSEYVRRSVANNLNDISKNQPDLIADLARDWLKQASPDRAKLVKHACRGLIKQGHTGALAAFGFPPPDLVDVDLTCPHEVVLGDKMPITLRFRARKDQKLLIDYVLHFMRANGKLSAKVFKWTEKTVSAGEDVQLEKAHPYKVVTTRKDYPGAQKLGVQINGQTVVEMPFELKIP
ncbi:DNA alkylation repair protein [Litoreibacter sp.]|nr:DNA alkylation repair protein [Litoreibacter sp.]